MQDEAYVEMNFKSWLRAIYCYFRYRIGNKNINPVIISENYIGGVVYSDMKLKFYMSKELRFLKNDSVCQLQ